MSCERVQALMGLGAELDRAEQLLLRRHLQDCDACRAAAVQEDRVRAYLAGLPDLPVPPTLQARLLTIPEIVATAGPLASLPFGGRLPLLLAVALLGFLGLWLSLRLRPLAPAEPQPPFLAPSSGTPSFGSAGLAEAPPTRPAAGQPASAGDQAAQPTLPAPLVADRSRATLPARRPPVARALDRAPNRDASIPDAAGATSGSDAAPLPATDQPAQGPGEERERGQDRGKPARPAPATPPATPPALPTEPRSAPTACLTFSAEVFLDLAGEGARPCVGCDGRFDEADEAAAQAAGLSLSPAMLAWVDALEQGDEGIALEGSGALVRRDGIPACGVLPLTVTLSGGLPEGSGLALCPGSSNRYVLGAEDEGTVLRWGIGLAECPAPTATPPSLEAETPAAPPPADPGAGGPPPDPPGVLSSGIVSAMP